MQYLLAVDVGSWDATWPILPYELGQTGKWIFVGHGSGEDVNDDALLENLQATLASSNWAKYNFQPLMFHVYTLDVALGRHNACLSNASAATRQAVSSIQAQLEGLYKIASGVEDGYLPPIRKTKGQPATEGNARDFIDGIGILSEHFHRIVASGCLDTPFIGNLDYLVSKHPCFQRLLAKVTNELQDMDEDLADRFRNLPIPDPKLATFAFHSHTEFEELNEDELEVLKEDMLTYTQSLAQTYPERLDHFEGFQLVQGFPSFLSNAERDVGRDYGFSVDAADFLLSMVMHVGSQAHICNQASSGIAGAQDRINMHTTYALLLRCHFLGLMTDALTARPLAWFTNARDGTAFGLGHMDHTQSMHFGYTSLRPSTEQDFHLPSQNVLMRSWSTRGLHHCTFKLGRQSYNSVIRAFLGFAKRIAAVGGFRGIPVDVQTRLAGELQSLMDPNVDLTRGAIATGLTHLGIA